jgi:endonuclease YncB( thermonuclease family)
MALIFLAVAPHAFGQTFTSTGDASALVSDGDTLRLSGTSYRLWGIDAPELHQRCGDDWPAGIQAQGSLEYLIRGRKVECESRSYDRYGRTIALCRVDGEE